MADDPAVEAAARQIHKSYCKSPRCAEGFYYQGFDLDAARLVVAAVKPLIVEECAQAVEADHLRKLREGRGGFDGAAGAVAVVRALAGPRD